MQDPTIKMLADKGYNMIFSNYDSLYLDCGYSAWVGEGNNWCTPYKGRRSFIYRVTTVVSAYCWMSLFSKFLDLAHMLWISALMHLAKQIWARRRTTKSKSAKPSFWPLRSPCKISTNTSSNFQDGKRFTEMTRTRCWRCGTSYWQRPRSVRCSAGRSPCGRNRWASYKKFQNWKSDQKTLLTKNG